MKAANLHELELLMWWVCHFCFKKWLSKELVEHLPALKGFEVEKDDHIQHYLLNDIKKGAKIPKPIIFQIIDLKIKIKLQPVGQSINIFSGQNHTASAYHRCPEIPTVTNEVAMESRLLAEVANGIVGTGQVCSAGGNLTPPNVTVGRKERVCPGWCVFVDVCFCRRMKVKT